MAARTRSVAGGALRGLGAALVNRHQEERQDEQFMREQAIIRAREIRQDIQRGVERTEDRADRIAESTADRVSREHDAAATRKANADALIDVIPDSEGNAMGVRRSGDTHGLGFKVPAATGRGGSGGDDSSESAEKAWKAVIADYTYKTPEKLDPVGNIVEEAGETIDWDGIVKEFNARGMQDLAARAARRMSEDPGTANLGSNAAGRGDAARGTPPRASAPAAGGGQPQGSGTQADPYRATDQAAVDWFKQNAPAGAIIEVDGQLYQK